MPRSAVPGVAEAAAIGIPHPKWDERPLLVCVRVRGNRRYARRQIRDHLTAHVAKWWLPDAIEFVDELPHTATGKLSARRPSASSSAIIASPTGGRWWAGIRRHCEASDAAIQTWIARLPADVLARSPKSPNPVFGVSRPHGRPIQLM